MAHPDHPRLKRKAGSPLEIASTSVTVQFSSGVSDGFGRLQALMSDHLQVSPSASEMLSQLASGQPVILDDFLGTLPILAADALQHASNSSPIAAAWREIGAQLVESSPTIVVGRPIESQKR